MPKQLTRLVYRSKSCISHDDVAGLDAIFKISGPNNLSDDITGCLALPDGHFVQVLEGTRARVDSLMTRIFADTRHENVLVLGERRIRARLFPSWAMARPDPTPLSDQSFRIITQDGSGAQVTGILLGLLEREGYWLDRNFC